MISIVIPFFNHYDLVHRRLYELWSTIPNKDSFEIVLINDASTDQTGYEGNIAWWKQTTVPPLNIRYHKNQENLGFVGSMNLGARNTKGDLIVLLSNDVIITGDFADEILSKEDVFRNALIGNRLIDWDGGWNSFERDGKKVVVPYLEGWFIACWKDVWEKLGGFDPIYAPSDYEDVDLSTKATSLGIPLMPLGSKFLEHMGAQSYGYNALREARTKVNRERFLAKWSDFLFRV